MKEIKQFVINNRKNIIGVSVAVVVLVLIVSIRINTEKDSKTIEAKDGETTQKTVEVPVVTPVVTEADRQRLEELKTKFNYKYDEFENKGWYYHKSQLVQNTFDKNVLRVYVNNVGYAYLADQYYSDDWLFHTRIEVKIGDSLYRTEDIPTYDSDNSTEIGSGSIWETIDYTAGRDNGIIEAIAESGTTTIKVRFAGDRGVYDIILAERDRQAIKDSYELSNLIRKIVDVGSAY